MVSRFLHNLFMFSFIKIFITNLFYDDLKQDKMTANFDRLTSYRKLFCFLVKLLHNKCTVFSSNNEILRFLCNISQINVLNWI